MDKRKVSTLFLDIKGGLDNMNPSPHCRMVNAKGVNPYLASWTLFFLTGRSCRLFFQGSPKIFSPVSMSNPQGSQVSRLLFVIYVSSLGVEIPFGHTLTYVEDFAQIALSVVYHCNIQLL